MGKNDLSKEFLERAVYIMSREDLSQETKEWIYATAFRILDIEMKLDDINLVLDSIDATIEDILSERDSDE